MKIIQINTVYGSGSTGKIVGSLYHISQRNNLKSYIAYGRGNAPRDINSYKIGNPFDFTLHVLSNFFNGNSGFSSKYVTKKFLKWVDSIEPDLLHLHNIHGFYINISLLFDYIKAHDIPVVWTLHDCWSFTGQCAHFDYIQCNKWKYGCSSCPIYKTNYPYSLFKDNSQQNYILKKENFSGVKKLIIVTPSNWLAHKVEDSFLNYPIRVIPNGIDVNIFKPIPLKVSNDTKIILGVANVWDSRKGFDTFLKLSQILENPYKIVLVGLNRPQKIFIKKNYPKKIVPITKTSNQQELACLYNSAFIFVNPTLEDNFPTTNLEALACGTPVITYDTGGSPESINSNCGIVVPKGDVDALHNAIITLENNQNITKENCIAQSNLFEQNYCFQKYISLYKELTNE